ncbi:MAG TPA: RHS repeat-associated core domain-containing protein [Candidatus Dormibacteraeota bacterium]|nr:RHS repeat-associated core domain-containing protein [Candidatus Dormibacteraeota bacterium]
MGSAHLGIRLRRDSRRFKACLSGFVATSVVVGLLPLAAGPLAPAIANAASDHLVFTTEPGDGDPGSALAAQPVVTIEDGSNATVDTSSTIALTLTGPGGAALSGLLPVLTCDQASNSMSASHGVAAFTGCTVNRGGIYTLTATDATDGSITAVSSNFFVSGPSQVVFTAQPTGGSGGTAGAAWSNQPQVTVEDAHGTAVTGATPSIGLAIKGGTGTAGAALTCTANPVLASSSTGIATFAGCKIDKVGTGYELVATDSTDNLISPTSDPFAIAAGSPAKVVFTTEPSSSAFGGTAFGTQPAVAVEDAGNNIIQGNADHIQLAIKGGTPTTGGPGALSCTTNPAVASNGAVSFTGCSLNTAGTGYKLTATDTDHSLSADSNPINVQVGSAAQISFSTNPGGGAAATPFATQPVVHVTDAGGNPVAGSVNLTIKSGTGAAGAVLSCTSNPLSLDSSGNASFAGCQINLASGSNYQLHAASGSIGVDSTGFSVSGNGAAASATFAGHQPGNGTGGGALSPQPQVTLTDGGGNPASGAVTLSITSGTGAPGAVLSCDQNPVNTNGSGVAVFTGCAIDKIGSDYTLTATSGAAGATSDPFNVTVGAPAQVAFVQQPSGGSGGQVWATQPVVQIQDAGGNETTSTATVSLSITPLSATGVLSCTALSLPAVNGSAQFSGCSIDKAGGGFTLTAHSDGLTDGISDPFAITVGPPAQLKFFNQPGGDAAGVVWPRQPVVEVADAGGNAVNTSSASIGLAIAPGSGTGGAALSCDTNPLNASVGFASFTGCSIDKAAGGYSLIATDTDDSLSAESLPFSILLPPPGPLGLAPQGVPLAQTFGGRVYGVNPTSVSDDVNTATGSLTFSVNDLNVAGIGEPLSLIRTYNSMDTGTPNSVFGPGWTSLLDVGVVLNKNVSALVRGEDGQQLLWTYNTTTNSYVPPPGAQGNLQCSSKTCTFTRNDGVSWDVNLTANGENEIQDYLNPDGQGLHFTWSAGSVSIGIANTTGKAYNVVATLSGGHVTAVTTPSTPSVPGQHRTVSYGYTGGLLTSVTDTTGHTWVYSYTGGLLTSMFDPLGSQRLVARYDSSSRAIAVQLKGSPQHADDTFTYSSGTTARHALITFGVTVGRVNYTDHYVGNVLVEQDTAAGAITRYSYDAQVNLIESQDPLGWVSTYTYDANNNLIAQSSPITATQSATTHFTYDPSHRLLTQTDADGNTVTYVYNGPVVGFIRPPNIQSGTSYTYNKVGELVEVDGPLGKALYQYDAFGNRTVVLQQTLGGAALNGKGTLTTYDEAGDILSTTDPRGTTPTPHSGFTTTRTYDAAGRPLQVTPPVGPTTSTAYTAAGDIASTTDAAAHVTTYAWNEATLTRTSTVGGHSTTDVYDASGNLLSETGPGNRTTTHIFNVGDREISTVDPSNVVTNDVYDIEGNVVAVSDNTGQTLSRDYDSRNRLIRQVSDGQVSLTSYDPAGRVLSTTAPNGSVTTSAYDVYGNVTSVHDANGTTSYTYDGDNNLLTRTDPDGHVTSYAYNGADQQTSMTTAGATTSYAYDVAGNLTQVTDPDGRVTAYTLNGINQPLATVYSQPSHTSLTVNQTFDALGRRTGMSGSGDATGPHAYGYDANGNLSSVTSAQGTFTYDYISHPGQIIETYPDGTHVTYSTDDVGNLMSVSTGTVSANYVRNVQRQTVGIAYGNGVYQSQRTDVLGDVLHQTLTLGATTLADKSYGYDAGQSRLSYVDDVLGTVTTDTYNYSTTGRLTAFSTSSGPSTHTTASAPPPLGPPSGSTGGTAPFAGTGNAAPFNPTSPTAIPPTYGYDGNGNMLSGNGLNTTYGSADQITGQTGTGSAPYSYDHAGNVTAKGSTGLVYDAAGHLVSASTPSGTVTYAYDGDGNRVSRTLNGVTTKYVWDTAGAVPLLAIERDGSNALIRRYINGEGPVAMQTSTATYYMHLDPQGTVTELTDSTGAVVAAYHYDGFGNLLSTDGGTPPANDLLFQGQLYDSATGLYYMRARDYDPSTGRFTRRDAVTPATGTPAVSPYAFVADMPTLLTDATGMTALATATSIFWGKSSEGANIGTDVKYGITAVKLGVKAAVKATAYLANKAASKVASIIDRISSSMGSALPEATQIAEDAGRTELHAAGAELETAGETAAKFGKASEFLGPAMDIIGIGLQTFITVEDCEHGPVAQCVGDTLGLAINIGFTVGCAVATEGTATAVCAIVGAILSVAVQELVTRYGPVIADFAVSVYKDAAAGIESAATAVAGAAVHYYNVVAGGINTAIGAISTGINKLTASISSGFNTAINALVDAGYTAVQLGNVLKNVFNEGLKDTVAALVNFGYQIADIANLVKNVFNATAQEAAQLFKDAFNYAVDQVAGILKDVYNLADEAAATILKAVNYAVAEVGTALKDIYNDAVAAVGTVLKDIGYAAQQIGAVFQHVFNEIDSAVAAGLKALGYAVDVVATALRNLYNDIDAAVAAALKTATFLVNEIATALKDVFNDLGQVAANILKSLTYTVDQIAGALRTIYNLLDQAAAQILENISFAINEVATALKDIYLDIDTAVASVLRAIGNTVTEIATALNVVFTELDQAVATVLKDVGFVIDDIATALHNVFADIDSTVANVLKAVGFLANEVASALQDVFADAAQAAAQILKDIGYTIDQIAAALQTVFGEAAEAAATVLKAIGYAASEIANALVDIFNEIANDVGQILKDIGEAASDIANVLENVFGEAASDIANFLSSIGFDTATIDAIGSAFASFGQSVADCFTSFFSDC